MEEVILEKKKRKKNVVKSRQNSIAGINHSSFNATTQHKELLW